MQHAIGDFIDGPVPSRRDNQVAAALDLPPCLRGCASWTGGRNEACFYALSPQQSGGTLEQVLAAR